MNSQIPPPPPQIWVTKQVKNINSTNWQLAPHSKLKSLDFKFKSQFHFSTLGTESQKQQNIKTIPLSLASFNQAVKETKKETQKQNIFLVKPPKVELNWIDKAIIGQKSVVFTSNRQTPRYYRLLAQERGGNVQEFEFSSQPNADDSPQRREVEIEIEQIDVVEVVADQQEYNDQQQIITAKGNVVMRFAKSILTADRLEVNLPNRVAVAQGKVVLRRGEQVLRGDKFEYYFVQDNGVIFNASGEIYTPSAERDFSPGLNSEAKNDALPDFPLGDRLSFNQPLTRVTTTGGYKFVLGSSRNFNIVDSGANLPSTSLGGAINRFRFQAEKVTFDGKTWQAENIRVTNDPFSPPELEIRADKANFRNIAPRVDELTTTNSRIVVDDNVALPLFQDRLVFDSRSREPGLFRIGIDGDERDGVFIERTFTVYEDEETKLDITPQYFLQKAVSDTLGIGDDESDVGVVDPSVFGLKSKLRVNLDPRTNFIARGTLTSFDLEEIDEELRAKISLQRLIGKLEQPHQLRLEYNYRDRLFNGSLGFRTVESSFGAILTSPTWNLGDSGVNLSYQASIQNINAKSDRDELIGTNKNEEVVNLTRYQTAASVRKNFYLWQGDILPATATEGLRYSPTPIRPYLELITSLTGVSSFYSNGDSQESLRARIGIRGQFGHFSEPWFDYTGFNISYAQGINGNESPFLFDRDVDTRTLSFGIVQQLYGPIRIGFQTSLS
ncbi:MAG: DUF3769 domain-containing protein, partial [Cyanobacteria bacterium J083]